MKRYFWIFGLVVGFALVWGGSFSQAYEVWLADQSDSAKESGGFLYIYDGAKLAADPAKAQPEVTLDLGKEVNDFCQKATQKAVRRPHMIFVTNDQTHALLSFYPVTSWSWTQSPESRLRVCPPGKMFTRPGPHRINRWPSPPTYRKRS